MALTGKKALAVAKKYTDNSILGIAGSVAGKSCSVSTSRNAADDGTTVTFKWYDDSTGAYTTTSTNIPDGVDVVSSSIDSDYHLILTLSDGTTQDSGLLPSGQDGISPTAFVTKTTTGLKLTVIDANGTTEETLDVTGMDLSDYYTKDEINAITGDMTTIELANVTSIVDALNKIYGLGMDTYTYSNGILSIVRKNGDSIPMNLGLVIQSTSVGTLKDVSTVGIANGDSIVWDSAQNKFVPVTITGTDEKVKMFASDADATYLEDKIDKDTIDISTSNKLQAVKLLDQQVTIAEINYLKGLKGNIQDTLDAISAGNMKIISAPFATHADLLAYDRTGLEPDMVYMCYVQADETHNGDASTYLITVTDTNYFAPTTVSVRDFTTNPISLVNEVTGKLKADNIEVDEILAKISLDNTYKTLTTDNKIFGTQGANAMYDELITALQKKVNISDIVDGLVSEDTDVPLSAAQGKVLNDKLKADEKVLTEHTGNSDIHVTLANKQTWNTVTDKIDKTSIATTIDSTSTDDTVPTNKAVYDNAIKDKKLKTYSISIVDDFPDAKTLTDISNNLPSNSIAVIDSGHDSTSFFGLPSNKFTIVWVRRYSGRDSVMAYTATGLSYICTNIRNQTWKILCTTSVEDSSGTVTLPNGVTGTISYKVINGICYVSIRGGLAGGLTGIQALTFTGLPKADGYVNAGIENLGNCVGSIYSDDGVTFYVHKTATSGGYGSFSYPVAE